MYEIFGQCKGGNTAIWMGREEYPTNDPLLDDEEHYKFIQSSIVED